MTDQITIPVETEQGEIIDLEIQTKFEVCPRCKGTGSHVNPSIDGHGISSEEWYGPDWDDDSRDMYMSGGYDVSCRTCHGKRVVAVADYDRLTAAERVLYETHLNEEAAYQSECEMERRMGA